MIYIKDNLEKISVEELEKAIKALPEWRKTQTLRFKFHKGRVECAFSYLLLCEALRDRGFEAMPTFIYGKEGQNGKPSLQEYPNVYFNLSHCKRAIVCAVANHPVGIDVESLGHYSDSLAKYTMNDQELKEIATSEDKDIAFTRLWTKKEATMKLTGEGISTNVREVLHLSSNIIYTTTVNIEKGYVVTLAEYAANVTIGK